MHLYLVSYNSIQTLRFEYSIIFLNTYTSQIWTQSYVYLNVIKYKVTIVIVIETFFSISYLMEENRHRPYKTNI